MRLSMGTGPSACATMPLRGTGPDRRPALKDNLKARGVITNPRQVRLHRRLVRRSCSVLQKAAFVADFRKTQADTGSDPFMTDLFDGVEIAHLQRGLGLRQ